MDYLSGGDGWAGFSLSPPPYVMENKGLTIKWQGWGGCCGKTLVLVSFRFSGFTGVRHADGSDLLYFQVKTSPPSPPPPFKSLSVSVLVVVGMVQNISTTSPPSPTLKMPIKNLPTLFLASLPFVTEVYVILFQASTPIKTTTYGPYFIRIL